MWGGVNETHDASCVSSVTTCFFLQTIDLNKLKLFGTCSCRPVTCT